MTQRTQQPRPASSYRGNKPSKAQGRGAFKRALARQTKNPYVNAPITTHEAMRQAEATTTFDTAVGHKYASADEAFADVKAGVDAMKRQIEVEETVFNQINERIVSDHNLAAMVEFDRNAEEFSVTCVDEVSYDEVVTYNAEANHEIKLARRRERAAAKRLKAKEEYEIAKSYTD